jgi:uncharacterized protein YqjF (DUF2071 family)
MLGHGEAMTTSGGPERSALDVAVTAPPAPARGDVRGWVLYDGGCGVCSWWVPYWAPTLARLGLGIAPLQAPWVAGLLPLPPDALVRDIRLLFRDGSHLAGADVYRHVMRRLWWAYPLYLGASAPGLRRVFDAAYRAFADRRLRISHACGLAARQPFLTAQWRHLVMLTWEVEPALLAPRVPAGTTLDLHDGRALVSVVGFRFLDTRVRGVRVPGHRDFDEVNLRFYVRRETGGAPRRGVVFVRELVPRAAVSWLARRAYNEPYRTVPMRAIVPPALDTPGRRTFEWRTAAGWQRVAATAEGAPAVPAPGSVEDFLVRHHWGYTRQADGGTLEYEVEHPPWRVWRASEPVLEADVAGLYGAPFVSALSRPPVSALVAEGSPVVVYRPRHLV